eukprot:scaffold87325_cov48-Phaeocystis_antarctica.AAC.1
MTEALPALRLPPATLATTGAAKRWMVAEAVSQSVPMQPWTWMRMMPVGSLAPLRMRVGFAASSALSPAPRRRDVPPLDAGGQRGVGADGERGVVVDALDLQPRVGTHRRLQPSQAV